VQLDVQEHAWLYMLPEHPIRKLCLSIYYNAWFDRFILTTILINCVFLAIKDPKSPESAARNQISLQSELIFTLVFTVEMLIKMTACGVFGRNSYFSDKWNWLDSLVVFAGYV
jgi:hypothetical protein